MAKRFMSKRVLFKPKEQKKFLNQSKKITGLSWVELAQLLKISNRTLTDWKKEKFSMSLKAVKLLSKRARLRFPENVEVKNPFWYVYKGAKIGGFAVYKKYGYIGGDPEKRKKKWYEWWEREGKYKKHPFINVCIPIKKPRKSKELAEFIGIAIGDGGISKYQIVITLHKIDDLEYSKFVNNLMKKLFGISPSIYYRPNYSVINITISRVELVKFFVKMGLRIGNKIQQGINIPKWIKNNNRYKIACLRGLIDTDGSIIIHKYRSRGKYYTYKKIGFTSRSPFLLKSVSEILNGLNIKHRFMKRYDIRIEAKENVKNYFKIVGTHNPKHLKRYYK